VDIGSTSGRQEKSQFIRNSAGEDPVEIKNVAKCAVKIEAVIACRYGNGVPCCCCSANKLGVACFETDGSRSCNDNKAGSLTWRLDPLMDDQELDSRQSSGAVYWEGAVRVGRDGAVPGRAYLELTGYGGALRSGRP
jgi:hypothetical protein